MNERPALASAPELGGHERAAQAAETLRTFTESQAPITAERIRAMVCAAHLVIFLGFGFHRQNMELLTLPDGSDFKGRVLATRFGVHEANLVHPESSVANALRIPPGGRVDAFDMPAHALLRDLRLTIVALAG